LLKRLAMTRFILVWMRSATCGAGWPLMEAGGSPGPGATNVMIRLPWRIPYLGAVSYAVALGLLLSGAYWYVGYRDLLGLHRTYQNGEVEVEDLQRLLHEDKAKAETLKAHVAGLDSDPIELEAAMRRNKNVVREGEKIFRFELAPARRDRPVASVEDIS